MTPSDPDRAGERRKGILGTVAFLLLAPGIVAGLGPWLITGWDAGSAPALAIVVGTALIAAGASVLLDAFARFALEGRGTPAPVAPTAELVVSGPYRYVRNPMYLAVGSIIAGQAVLFGSAALAVYLLAFAAAVLAFVRLYEEPALSREFGGQYEAYRRAVRGWIPRIRPWSGGATRRASP